MLNNDKIYLYRLLKQIRPSIKVHYNYYSHQWGLVPKFREQKPFDETAPGVQEDIQSFIYKLHWGIKMQPEKDKEEIEELIYKIGKVKEHLDR